MPTLLAHLFLPTLSTMGLAMAVAAPLPRVVWFAPGVVSLMAGVLLVYLGDRLWEPGRIGSDALRRGLWTLAGVALVACIAAGLMAPARLLPIEFGLGFASLCYGLLKKYAVIKSLLVAACWWVACTQLPFDLSDAPPESRFAILWQCQSLALFLLVGAGAIMCDYKDESSDRNVGVLSLPILIGARRTTWVTAAMCLSAAGLSALGGASVLVGVSILLMLLGTRIRFLTHPLHGPLAVDGVLAMTWPFVGLQSILAP